MRCLRSLLTASVLLFTCSLFAQTPEIAPRINAPVNEKALLVLKGNVSAAARAEFDRGQAPPSATMPHVRLVLSRSDAQQAALDKYDAELQDKSSPNYQKWLTPEQYGKLFGPADADIAAIVAWLEAHGLQVDPIWPGHTNISFSGSVLQVEELFHTSIHSFEINGEPFYANISNPSIPAALGSVISGVARLNTKKPRPMHVAARTALFDPATGKRTPLASSPSSGSPSAAARAELTGGTGSCPDPANSSTCQPYLLYLVPGDAATIYDTPNTVLNANYTSGTSYTGTGVTIGIGGDATINAGTVALFRQAFLGNTTQPTISYCGLYVDSPATPACSGSSTGLNIGTGDRDEAYIDTELSAGLAPGATIHYYASYDLIGAIEAAINENTIDIFSLSFGACELDLTTADNVLISGFWQQAATQGIPVTVSTGDDGSAACDNNNGQATANGGLKVSGFASTPYNIAVGGTDFAGLLPTGSTYSSTNFLKYVSAPGAGDAAAHFRTALKYIPESTWNDSTSANTTISQNAAFTSSNIVAGSGGKSTCSVNTTTYDANNVETKGTCTSGYVKPFWQRGAGVPNDGARDLPDISLMGGAGGDYAAWTVCTDDPISQGSLLVSDCSTQSDGQSYIAAFGGTSTSAPAFAGILALVQQKAGHRLGQAAKDLYDLYNGTHSSAVFHDITVGNISVPCDAGTPDCQTNTHGDPFLTGYDTGPGYDLATGIGSVDARQLVTYWGSAIGTAVATVTVTPAAATLNSGVAFTVAATITGASGTPTGTVALSGAGYTSPAGNLDSNGAFTFTIPAYSFTSGGPVTLTVNYSGDATYNTTSGTADVNITLRTFTLSATAVTVPAGAVSGNVSTVTVTPVSGYTGTVVLTAAVTSSPGTGTTPTLAGSSVAITDTNSNTGTISVTTTAAAAVRAQNHPPAGWFRAAGGTALAALLLFCLPLGSRRNRRMLSLMLIVAAATFTAAGCGSSTHITPKTTPSVTVSPAKSTITSAEAVSVVIGVGGGTSTATGTVSLSGGGYTGTATALVSGAATVNIPANSFTSTGSVTLTASYSGDSNYNSASGTKSITVNKAGTTPGAYTITVTGTDAAAHLTQTTTFTLTVN